MKKILLSTFIAAFSISELSCAASFDCAKAASATEKLICSDEKISALDEQLAKSYKAALDKSSDKDAFKKTQIEWLKQQRACKDVDCLARSYQGRITELNGESNSLVQSGSSSSLNVTDSTNSTNKKPLTFKLVYGDSYPICKPYVDMLNKTKYTEYPACERKILPEFSQFKTVQWTEVKNKEESISIVEEYSRLYAKSVQNITDQQLSISIKNMKENIKSGSSKVYMADIDLLGDGSIEKVYRYDFNFFEAKKFNACEVHSVFYVNDKTIDVGKDLRVQFREKGYDLLNRDDANFFYYDNKIYQNWWSGKGYKYDITINKISSVSTEICGIKIQ